MTGNDAALRAGARTVRQQPPARMTRVLHHLSPRRRSTPSRPVSNRPLPSRPTSAGRRGGVRFAVVAGSVSLAVLVSGCGAVRAGAAAVVGDQRIPASDIRERVDRVLAAPGGTDAWGTRVPDLQRRWTTQLITRDLLGRAAREQGVSVSGQDADAALAELAQQSGGREALQKRALATNGIAAQDLPAVGNDLALQAALADRLVTDPVPEDQLRQAYTAQSDQFDTVTLRVAAVTDRQVADQIAAAAKADASQFADLVKANSVLAGVASDGDVGQQSRSTLPPVVADAVYQSTGNGEIVGPVAGVINAAGQQGYYVIQVLQRTTVPFDQARQQLRRAIQSDDRDKAVNDRLLAVARSTSISVSPRFGRWDVDSLSVQAAESDLSSPGIQNDPKSDLGTGGGPANPSASPGAIIPSTG